MRRRDSLADGSSPAVQAESASSVWPPGVTVDGGAAGWRWGEGGDGDGARRETLSVVVRVTASEAAFRLQVTSLEAPVDGRVAVELSGSPAELALLLKTLRSEARVVAFPEDRGLVTLRLGATVLRFDLLDGVVRLTPTGDPR